MDLLKSVQLEQQKQTIPSMKVGDTVKVYVRINEGTKQRVQRFEGTVIKKQNGGVNETFTVRRISYGVGVEKTFLIHSPLVEKVEVLREGIVRRAKLTYLRDRVGKATKVTEKIFVKSESSKEATQEVIEESVVEETIEPLSEEVKEETKIEKEK